MRTRLPGARTWWPLPVLLAGLLGCGAAEAGPRWIRLARGEAGPISRSGAPAGLGDNAPFEVVFGEEGAWIEIELTRARWREAKDERPGTWSASMPFLGNGRPADGSVRARLEGGGRSWNFAPRPAAATRWDFPPGSFAPSDARLLLRLEEGVEPPANLKLSVFAARDRAQGEGRYLGGTRFSGDGFSLWSGEQASWSIDAPAGSAVRFAAVVEPALTRVRTVPSVTFAVRWQGETIHEETLSALEVGYRWVSVPLPVGGGRGELEFEASGALAFSSIQAVSVGPSDKGSYGARPWGDSRPDIVVFLADTFRADNMRAYGGSAGTTPFLDELAERVLCFERAWSVGTFTLPAHASMFSGLFPHQVGIIGTGQALPEDLVTVGEVLSANGYRTGAITDAVIVSQSYGLAQGFEWFDEDHDTLESTLERAESFLEADDGRPSFLFVHTYRTHVPYHVTELTRREIGDELGIHRGYRQLVNEMRRLQGDTSPEALEAFDQILAESRALYLGGTRDLDRGFQGFYEGLEERGLFDQGYLLFTSDHGEAFGEHGEVYHTGPVWDVLSRVPLLIQGPGVEGRRSPWAASLVDLPRTLADMAGVQADGRWLGSSLLQLSEDRPAFVFECQRPPASTLALIDGKRKVIGFETDEALDQGQLFAAFELDRDPAESLDVAGREDWPRELLEQYAAPLRAFLRPVVGARAAELDEAQLDELRAMGYAGD